MERALRGWQDGRMAAPMTPDQRETCLAEIERVEGYSRGDHERDIDKELARTVLTAWTDYCRDKGLLP